MSMAKATGLDSLDSPLSHRLRESFPASLSQYPVQTLCLSGALSSIQLVPTQIPHHFTLCTESSSAHLLGLLDPKSTISFSLSYCLSGYPSYSCPSTGSPDPDSQDSVTWLPWQASWRRYSVEFRPLTQLYV